MRIAIFAALAVAALASVPTAHGGNREIALQIGKDLRASGQLTDYNISVKYKDGTAWLSGRVSNEQQLETALSLAQQCEDVTRVVNQLQVGRGGQRARGSMRMPRPGVRHASAEQYADSSAPELMPANAPRMPMPAHRMARRPVRRVDHVANCPPGSGMVDGGMMDGGMVDGGMVGGGPLPATGYGAAGGAAPAMYDNPSMPNYAWPSYAAYPNYAALTYPKQYSPTAWPYIGPFYPYPQVPLGWRKVTLEWDDGWWFLDFKDSPSNCW
ncbi:MAG: BON domain-containing protein [Pirellulales bacterium]|nr:BON domain-containing protein [Pirellulales bacterium]